LDTSNLSLLANSRNVNTSMEKAKLMNSAIAYQTLNATANYQLQLLSNFFN
jgi:spore germination protein YaaH